MQVTWDSAIEVQKKMIEFVKSELAVVETVYAEMKRAKTAGEPVPMMVQTSVAELGKFVGSSMFTDLVKINELKIANPRGSMGFPGAAPIALPDPNQKAS
jgi:hypothetical protein